ncbi:MAG TPA: hypothetical protein VF026_30125 [Ktedonobacteraceae bacterium]
MSTEERIVALEQGMADVQRDFLVHLSENNQHMAALNKVISMQELHSRDLDHNVTMLLGIAGSQGKDIKTMQNDLSVVKERVEGIDRRLEGVDRRLGGVEQRLEGVDRRLEGFEQRFTSVEGKLEQILQILTNPRRTDK